MAGEIKQIGSIYMVTSGNFVINKGLPLNIESIGFFSASTAATAELQFVASESSGSARAFCHFVNGEQFQSVYVGAILSGVSASIVTACTGWIYLKV